MASLDLDNICIPVHLDAFVLSPGSCDGESSLAPYTQPNYTSLRLDSHLIQNDVLEHADLHLSSPAWSNPRIADLARSPGDNPNNATFTNRRQNRMGVHLSWSLPRLYRTAQASGKRPRSSDKPGEEPNPNPRFRPIPNRWMVVRHLKGWTNKSPLKEWQSWVVESDAVQKLTKIRDMKVDLESEVSPFVQYLGDENDPKIFDSQTEVFLGQKFDLAGGDPWKESKAAEHLDQLTIMSSANPLFADNALHNSNVLSIIDNFSYTDGLNLKYLTAAECDYFLVGWHSKPADDPFNQIVNSESKDLSAKLSDMLLQLSSSISSDANVTTNASPTRCLVHGAIYGVKYDVQYNPRTSSVRNLANETAHKFTSQINMEPLSVGTTPLDGIITYLTAHQVDSESTFGKSTKTTVDLLVSISQLLYATGDTYDSRIQAQDILSQQNFGKFDGGNKWMYAETTQPGQPPKEPDGPTQLNIRGLNEAQTRLDTSTRKLKSLQWQLFAEWWKLASKSLPVNYSKDDKENIYRPIRARADTLASLITEVSNQINSIKDLLDPNQRLIDSNQSGTFKQTTNSPYSSRMDPTLCIAGMNSGWPKNWDQKLPVRLHSELTTDISIVGTILGGSTFPVTSDHGLDQTARRLFAECFSRSGTDNGADQPNTQVGDGRFEAPQITGFQSWGNRIPFVPLYIEWEGIYYHVGPQDDKWDVQLRPSAVGHRHPAVRYTPKQVLSENEQNQKDFRMVSGRVMVLPQPVFSLKALVMQVLDDSANASGLSDDQKTTIRTNIDNIQFVSAPLSGLTNHLLTRVEGQHVKPNVRVQGLLKPIPLVAAFQNDVGINATKITLMDGESACTPYADLFPFSTDEYPHAPFKPVTHGQMMLTKLNIIDKFGQAVSMPKILRKRRVPAAVPTSNIYPCMGDLLSPDIAETLDGHKFLNTVVIDPKAVQFVSGQWQPCQYMQFTPAINQDARVNGSFLIRDTIDVTAKSYTTWREATDYDPMIWGWIIINYADNGLQLFLGDGTFYAEVRRGGVEGTTIGAKWLPYDKPSTGDQPQTAGAQQLSELLDKLRDTDYFENFANMINGSILNMPFAPSEYSSYANSVVGKPLALVNVGWSLELAEPAIKSQNSQGISPAWEGEVNDDVRNMKRNDPQNSNEWKDRIAQWDREVRNDFQGSEISQYQFPIKIGDMQRNYDGMVGYWHAENDAEKCETHWQNMYTYFKLTWSNLIAGTNLYIPTTSPQLYTVVTDDTLDRIATNFNLTTDQVKAANKQIPFTQPESTDSATNTFQPISPQVYPRLAPFYLDPLQYKTAIDLKNFPSTPPTVPSISILADRAAKYTVTPMLIDPYTAVHAYSPILPTRKIQLPPYAIQKAFEKMHAFFHLGPLLLTDDVPHKIALAKAPNATPVKLPVGGKKGQWKWFQPYATTDDLGSEDILDPEFAEMDVSEDLGEGKFVKGPYTFVEGFLQLVGTLDQRKAEVKGAV